MEKYKLNIGKGFVVRCPFKLKSLSPDTCFATDSRPEIKKQTSTTKTYRHSGSDTPETHNTRGKAWDRPGRVEPSEPVLRFGTSWNTLFRFWPGFSVGKQVAEDRNQVRPSPKRLLSHMCCLHNQCWKHCYTLTWTCEYHLDGCLLSVNTYRPSVTLKKATCALPNSLKWLFQC